MLTDSASSGDRLQTLRDLRDLLARQVQSCHSMRDLAALSGRLESVLDQIAKLEPKRDEGDGLDQIAARRAARRASVRIPARARRSGAAS